MMTNPPSSGDTPEPATCDCEGSWSDPKLEQLLEETFFESKHHGGDSEDALTVLRKYVSDRMLTPEEAEHIQLGRYNVQAAFFGTSTNPLDNSIFAKCARVHRLRSNDAR